MSPSETPGRANDQPTIESTPPGKEGRTENGALPMDAVAGSRTTDREAAPVATETGSPLPPGHHPHDPVKKDLDPIGFALERVQTFLVWIGEHRATFESYRDTDPELAQSELSNLRDATMQGMVHLQRLSELLLAGYTIDPGKRLPESLCRGWFSSIVDRLRVEKSDVDGTGPEIAG
jgi:hypothetical protein